MKKEINYIDQLPAGFIMPAARLYTDALKDKLVPTLGDKAHLVLCKNLAPEYCLAAIYSQKLAGVLAVQTGQGSFWQPTLKSFIEEYGLIGGLFRFSGLYPLHHAIKDDEWYIDGIAVAKRMRGKGIGSGLLALLESIAIKRGIGKLSIGVVDTNPRARALYERLGFVKVKKSRLWPLNHIYGFPFESATEMVKNLSGPKAQFFGGKE